ncbi:hypothetical protein V5O39_30090 [Pseudomonas parakoreensis]
MRGLSPQRLYAVRARLTLYEGFLLSMRLQPQQARARLLSGLAEARACRDISVLIGHCVIARLDGSSGEFARAFAELAEAERLMHIWDVPPIYYLAMITLVNANCGWCRAVPIWPRPGWRVLVRPIPASVQRRHRNFILNCHCMSNCSKRCSM